MRLFLLAFAIGCCACASSSSGTSALACDDTPVPTTAGATCTVPGKYTLTSTPRCNQDRCSEDASAPLDVDVTCTGNDCKIEGTRSTSGSSAFFSYPCVLNGCACRRVGGATGFIFDANGFVGEGPSIRASGAGVDGGSCVENSYYKGTRK